MKWKPGLVDYESSWLNIEGVGMICGDGMGEKGRGRGGVVGGEDYISLHRVQGWESLNPNTMLTVLKRIKKSDGAVVRIHAAVGLGPGGDGHFWRKPPNLFSCRTI